MKRGPKTKIISDLESAISDFKYYCCCCDTYFSKKSNLTRHQKTKMNKLNPELENGLQILKKAKVLKPTPEKLS